MIEFWGNIVEGCFWILVAAVIALKTRESTGYERTTATRAAIAFLLFGVSDFIESTTGAWYKPLTLLFFKAACILVFINCFLRHKKYARASVGVSGWILLSLIFPIFPMTAKAEAPKKMVFPPPGSTVAQQALLQSKLEKMIPLLDSKTWKRRETAGKRILTLLSKNPQALRFFMIATRNSREPEIRFQGQRVLKLYFEKHIYNPKKKMGFIGISLAVGGFRYLNGFSYMPIRVVFTQPNFPGEKAGIKACDLILEVDGIKCARDFSVEEFVKYISSKSPGETVVLTMLSRGKKVERKVVLAERPKMPEAPSPRISETEQFENWLQSLQ